MRRPSALGASASTAAAPCILLDRDRAKHQHWTNTRQHLRKRLFVKQSIPLRLGLLVAGMVLPLTIFAAVLVYYNYEANRRTAYDRVLQIARGVAVCRSVFGTTMRAKRALSSRCVFFSVYRRSAVCFGAQ
jgi:hypothetical protein